MSARLIFVIMLAISSGACAKKDSTVESVSGTEPQRLSFGPPPQVMASFVEKMKLCWFSGKAPYLSGYRYETGERPQSDEANPGYQNIKIYNVTGGPEIFEIQFHKYNENTLIVTRNLSLQTTMIEKLKRDIQLWALTGPDCSNA